ncbi:MAG: hypothetical protein Q9M29_09100, partial [Mariprofundaceae bacterium]|nr:hypothetical protein [Mariprofundaceae bacterium]
MSEQPSSSHSAMENWREEKQAAYLYRLVAQREQDEEKTRLFLALAQAAETQAAIWARKLQEAGIPFPGELELTTRIRIVAWLIKVLGPRAIRPILAAMKVRGLSIYSPGMI